MHHSGTSDLAVKAIQRRTLELKEQLSLYLLDLGRGQTLDNTERRLEGIITSCLILQDSFAEVRSRYGNLMLYVPSVLDHSGESCSIKEVTSLSDF